MASKLLIVDDDPQISKALQLFLKREGYEVIAARNGAEALKLLTESGNIPNIIIADVMMPEMDGYTLCEAVRKEESLADVSFLFLTSMHRMEDRLKGFKTGADDYMTKPFRMEALGIKIKGLLDLQFRKRPQSVFCSALKGIATWMLPSGGVMIPTCLNNTQCDQNQRSNSCPLANSYPVH